MKKHLLLFASLLSVVSLFAQSTVDINGTLYPIDTTASYQTGPGVWHTRYTVTIGSTQHHCYLLEIDLTNPYNTIEEWQSSMEFGKTQRLADAHVQMSAENHRPVGGVNCNFWVVASQNTGYNEGLLGQSFAGTARNGVLIGNPDDWNLPHGDRGYVMIDRNKKVHIEEMTFGAGIITKNNETLPIQEINRTRVNPLADEIVVFNEYTGRNGTRATDGVEVVFSAPEWKINGDMTCTVLSVNNTGGTVLTEGQGVLQGRGKFKANLEAFQVGDTFTMQLWVVGRHDASFQPDILQMVTGNCLVMRDGVLNDRNTNEGYNNQNYPRTMLATNNEGNKFWMMVAEKPGMFTAQMCALLKHAGATYAAGMDGGGSAQMCLDGQVLNPTTETSPRSVANSIWVLSTAPDDSVVTRLEHEQTVISLPKYGVFAPAFRSYNQYGVLLSHDQPDVTLSCDESVGYIDDKGAFVCIGDGTLTATHGTVTYTFQVIAHSAKVDIRLDSVLVMDDTDYSIEVYTTADELTLPISPASLTWTIADNTICDIHNGVLNGLQNGRTYVYGEIDGNKDSLLVVVQIPEERPLLWNTFTGDDAAVWEIKTGIKNWNATINPTTQGEVELTFTYSVGRQNYIKLQSDADLYGVPDYLAIDFVVTDSIIEDVTFGIRANNATKVMSGKFTDIQVGKTTHAVVDIKNLFGDDIAIHPLSLRYIQFTPSTAHLTAKQEYKIALKGVYLHYKNFVVTYDNPQVLQQFVIYPNPTSDELHIRGIQQTTSVVLFDLQGRTIANTILTEDGTLQIANLTAGTYVLQVGNETVKIIKQ